MPKIDPAAPDMPERSGTRYPEPYRAPCAPRRWKQLGAAAGLTDFGVNLVTVPPGAWSSQRHWHEAVDELLVMIEGELVLIDDHGRTPVVPGDVCAFPKNDGNDHHLVNESGTDARFLVVGANGGAVHYPDIDLAVVPDADGYSHTDGTPY